MPRNVTTSDREYPNCSGGGVPSARCLRGSGLKRHQTQQMFAVAPRRFPPPWRAKMPGANGQALAYVYSHDHEAEALQVKVLTKDYARRIAVNIARLPELLGTGDGDG